MGKLIKENGGGVRFMDSYLLGTIYDEVGHLKLGSLNADS
jgi:hypothetical protein